jgi:hypothetical protein
MAYIGREPQIGNFQVCDAITVVDAQAAYTMQVSSVDVFPETANHMLVSLNGILQAPTTSYTVAGSTITFASALETGDVIDFIQILGNVLDLGVPSDNTVTTAKLSDSSVTTAKLNDASVSLAKLTATGTKDATTFLRGDNTFAEAGGGDYVKLATTNISTSTSSVSFDGYFSPTYKNYFIIGSSLRPDGDPSLSMRYRISDADVTGSNYVSTRNTIRLENSTNDMEEDNNAIKQSYLAIASTLTTTNNTDSNSSKRACNFNLFLHDPLNTSYMKYCFGSSHHTYDNTNDVWYYHTHFAGTYTTDGSALSGFTVFPSSGNFTEGTISLYGLKH